MPKAVEDKLKQEAAARGMGEKQSKAFIYGTLRKLGWKPKQQMKK